MVEAYLSLRAQGGPGGCSRVMWMIHTRARPSLAAGRSEWHLQTRGGIEYEVGTVVYSAE